jgi:hypothetical protein
LIPSVTVQQIWADQITDNFFKAVPFWTYLRDKALMDFDGGTYMQYAFMFKPTIGGFYSPGASFNIDMIDTIAALQFREKYIEQNVTMAMEDIMVRNRGPRAVFSLVDAYMKNAMMTITAQCAIAGWRHGQASGSGVNDDRSLYINGLSEALNDGVLPSWDSNIFTTYGGQTRNGAIGAALNSQPQWWGQTNGSAGKVTYQLLESLYQTSTQGNLSPDLGVTSKQGMTLIKNTMQVQQRFAQETDPRYGFEGVKLNKMLITKDDYAPSAVYGVNDLQLGNYLTAAFTNPLTSGTPNGGFPTTATAATLTPGEVLFMINTDTWKLRLSTNPQYQFGFTGFKPGQDNTRVSGQVLAALNLECVANRLNGQAYGFSS